MTPEERDLVDLQERRKQMSAEGREESLDQQREYELALRKNLILDLEELKEVARVEGQQLSAPGHVVALQALISSGHLSKEALSDHPIFVNETKTVALKRLASLRDSNERLAMLDDTLCHLSDSECALGKKQREDELHKLEGEWGVN